MNLWDALTCTPGSSSLHCWVGDRIESALWSAIVRDAEAMTAALRRAGVRPGTRVASVLTNAPCTVRGMLGVWLAGGALASLPIPARGMDAAEYGGQLAKICGQLEPVVFLVEERIRELLPRALRESVRVLSWESLANSGRVDPDPPGDEELAFVQYSSGSTSAPKGCMLTPRAIMAQLELVMDMIEGRPGREVTVSWLPLSHDMGTFGCLLTPWAYDFDLFLSSPERFMRAPRTWFGDIAQFGATMTAGTNTALYLAARAYKREHRDRRLRLSVCIVGAERVEWDTLRFALDVLGPHGLKEEALMPAYGLAEATLAVTATPARQAPRHLALDAIALADGELHVVSPDEPCATRLISAGTPCKDVQLHGVGTERLSEIRVSSRALATGYFADPEHTRCQFRDGELLTGDLGFLRDGHLYPVGRIDDVISVCGRKVYSREIENAVDSLDGVRRGCSTIVQCHDGGATRLLLFLEIDDRRGAHHALANQAAAIAMAKAAIAIDACIVLPKGSLPKTPSGKIQRHRCRQLLDAGQLRPLASIELVPG
jgi:fatty-acyl-CoA synthase